MNKEKPTEFRGCIFDAEWEFDAPCVVYHPREYRAFGVGGNSGYIDRMVEEISDSISFGDKISDGGLARECEWRGWNINGFRKRKNAWHVRIVGHWEDKQGWSFFCADKREEQRGPFEGGGKPKN